MGCVVAVADLEDEEVPPAAAAAAAAEARALLEKKVDGFAIGGSVGAVKRGEEEGLELDGVDVNDEVEWRWIFLSEARLNLRVWFELWKVHHRIQPPSHL